MMSAAVKWPATMNAFSPTPFPSTRQARPARDVVHGERVQADLAAGGFRGVDDFRATALLFLESAFGDVIHMGRKPRLLPDAMSISSVVCKPRSMVKNPKCELIAFTSATPKPILRP